MGKKHERNEAIHAARRALAKAVILDELTADFYRIRGGGRSNDQDGYRNPDEAFPALENVATDMVKRLVSEGVIT